MQIFPYSTNFQFIHLFINVTMESWFPILYSELYSVTIIILLIFYFEIILNIGKIMRKIQRLIELLSDSSNGNILLHLFYLPLSILIHMSLSVYVYLYVTHM